MTNPGKASAALLASCGLLVALGCAAPTRNLPLGEKSEVRDVAGRLVVLNDAQGAASAKARASSSGSTSDMTHLGGALLARRVLDRDEEVKELLATVAAGPEDPVSLVALRRLAELAESSPRQAHDVELGIQPLQARLAGLFAYRARVARIVALEALGETARAAALRKENGAVTAWSLAGPFGNYPVLDFETAYPPEKGTWPGSVPAPLGLPARVTRALFAPDGTTALDGEPSDGDVYYLSSELDLASGGRYLVSLGTRMSARLWIDGQPIFERRAARAHLPTLLHAKVDLSVGSHLLLVKVARGNLRSALHVAFTREDGAPSDLTPKPATPGVRVAVQNHPPPSLFFPERELARALEPALGSVLSRYLAAGDALSVDREEAKALVSEAIGLAKGSASLLVTRAELHEGDPTEDEAVARAREEADLKEALRLDPGHADARVKLSSLFVRASRLDDADAMLAELSPETTGRPVALETRARAAEARGLFERAESLAGQADEFSTCGALELALSLAERRHEIGREDALLKLRQGCHGGRERMAGILRQRGDAKGEADELAPIVAWEPWNTEPALAQASALYAAGNNKGAVAAVDALVAIWPRNAHLLLRLADFLELSGDKTRARAARSKALLLDGSDLSLRRALALEDGREVLSDLSEDGDAAMKAYLASPAPTDTSATMVLDAAAVEIYPGGFATERTHQIIHVLDQHGVEQYGEISIPPGADVLILRTRKPDGRKLEPDRTSTSKGTVSLTGLEPGDYVEVEWLRSERGGPEGFVAEPFYFQVPNTRMKRSTYVVAGPASLPLEADAHGMPTPKVEREGDRLLVRAERRDIPPLLPEPGSSSAGEYLPFLCVGVGDGVDAMQRQLSEAVADKARPTEEVRRFASAVRDAAGPGASPATLVRAAYARVAKEVLGSGSLADDASEVLSRGRGSRLLALKAVLDELGLVTRFALVRSFSSDPAPYRFPSHSLYDQLFLRVTAGEEIFWLDPSLRQAPFGALPGTALDSEALLLAAPGEPLEKTRTPARPRLEDRRAIDVRVAVAGDGNAEISGSDSYFGALAAGVKAAVERLDPSTRRQAVESMLARSFHGLSVSEATFEGEENPEAPLVIHFKGTARDVLRRTALGAVLDGAPFASRLGSRYVQVSSRKTPLLIPQAEHSSLRMEVVPPEGLVPTLEPDVEEKTDFGSFSRVDRRNGRSVVRVESLDLNRDRILPDRYKDFVSFASAVDAAEERPMALVEATPGPISPSGPQP